MGKEKVRDWMTQNPITIPSTTTLPDAYWTMMQSKIRRLLVVDNGALIGIVTLEDLRRSVPTEAMGISPLKLNTMLSTLPIRQLMTPNPVTIEPATSLAEAARVMLKNKISALPVVEGDKVVGIITESDLFRVLAARD